MKAVFASLCLVAVVACSSDESGVKATSGCDDSVLVGSWKAPQPGEVLTFKSDCSGTSLLSGAFTYRDGGASSGTLTMLCTAATESDAVCKDKKPVDCNYAVATSGKTMTYACGGSAVSLTKDP
jgi:hypothetical protein